jgi:subtilisin family serine protease
MSFHPSTTRTRRRVLATCLAVSLATGLGLAGAGAAVAAPGDGSVVAAQPAPALPVVAGPVMNYAVNVTKANRGQTRKAESAVTAASGTVVASWPEIGVVIAQSDNANFAASVRADKSVASVGATRTAPVTASDPTWKGAPDSAAQQRTSGTASQQSVVEQEGLEAATAVTADPLEARQWDMTAIKADQAHQVTDGSKKVLVAVLDSGIQGDHPDLAANIDQSRSAGCLGGTPDTSYAAWQPTTSDHGTHVAGTIAAARNGVGIVGVAPASKLSAVKVVNDDGFIYAEAAICGFMYAESTGADVTNNSYFIDPWEFWCGSDVDQAAVKTAVDRAVQFTQRKGVVNVAAAGNSAVDLANKTVDAGSPNDTVPVTRQLDETCTDIPAELDGVVTVSSTTSTGTKSSFSNYGDGVIDVAAPGSSILSTVTGSGYGTKSGTSMASPHVAGVLALLKSTHPRAEGSQLTDLLYAQADDVACPATATTCVGTPADNGWFGEGLVDALDAVTAP